VHRLVQIGTRDEDAGRTAVGGRFRVDEREASGIGRDTSDDEVHTVGQSKALAADFDERARVDERPQLPLEGRALLSRNAKCLQQLFRCCGVIDLIANRAKDITFRIQYAHSATSFYGRAVARRMLIMAR
jgi:hypothetical protein